MYQAFAAGTRIWNRQDYKTNVLHRQEAVLRLIDKDIEMLRPYSYVTEKSKGSFFFGAPRMLFYVTSHGFGAYHRGKNALYFTCLYAVENDIALTDDLLPSPDFEGEDTVVQDDGYGNIEKKYSLYICKVSEPYEWLFAALDAYRTLSIDEREYYLPPEDIRSRSVFLAGSLKDLHFYYDSNGGEAPAGVLPTWIDTDSDVPANPLQWGLSASAIRNAEKYGEVYGDADMPPETSTEASTAEAAEVPDHWEKKKFPGLIRLVFSDTVRRHIVMARPLWQAPAKENAS